MYSQNNKIIMLPYNIKLLIDNIERYSKFTVMHIDINPSNILEKYYYFSVYSSIYDRDPIFPIYMHYKLRGIIRDGDILHTHLKNYIMRYAIRRKNRNKLVATVHNAIPEFITYLVYSDFHRTFNLKQVKERIKLLRHYDSIVTVSKFIRDILREIYGFDNITYIPNPIDIEYDVKSKVCDFDLGVYDLEPKSYIMWLGNKYMLVKNPLFFVYLAKEFPDETFVMASEYISYKKLIDYLGRYNINEIPSNLRVIELPSGNSRCMFLNLIKNAKFTVLTSYYEAFGYSVLESLSLNVPVIVPNIGGPNEIVTNDVGIKYDAFDRYDLFKKFEVMNKKFKKFKNLEQYVYRNYNPTKIVMRYDNIYEELLR